MRLSNRSLHLFSPFGTMAGFDFASEAGDDDSKSGVGKESQPGDDRSDAVSEMGSDDAHLVEQLAAEAAEDLGAAALTGGAAHAPPRVAELSRQLVDIAARWAG